MFIALHLTEKMKTGRKRKLLTITLVCVDIVSVPTVKIHEEHNPPCLDKDQTFYWRGKPFTGNVALFAKKVNFVGIIYIASIVISNGIAVQRNSLSVKLSFCFIECLKAITSSLFLQ